VIGEELTDDDCSEPERRRAAWEEQLLFPHMQAELDWLRGMQDAIVDAGLKQKAIRKKCTIVNIVSVGLALWMLLMRDAEANFFWLAVFLLASVATIGAYLAAAIALASHRSALSRINERARAIDLKLFGEMSLGSAIEKRIW
jgi:uncharacterized membrane protein